MAINRRKLLAWGGSSIAALALGSWYWPNRWQYIVVHHSAGNFGNLEFLQQVHRQRQANDPIDAIPYHFIVGNGNGMEMGEVASDWRKENHLWGAHVSANNSIRNFLGLGICMIGNFDTDPVPQAQFDSLVLLVKQLRTQYSICIDNISGHGLTNGESTKCPGKYFPMDELLNRVV